VSEVAIPSSWQTKALKDVARWGSGGTPKGKNPAYYGGDIPWAIIGDLNDDIVFKTSETITQFGLENSSAKLVPADSVLVAMYGSIGKLGINAVPLTTNQAIAFAVPDRSLITTKFLFLALLNERSRLIREGRGGTQQNISQTILKPWKIPVPLLAEQKRIVEILEEQFSRLDAALASVRLVREKTVAFRLSLLEATFSPPHADSGWQKMKLSDVAKWSSGGTPKSKTPEYYGGNIPWAVSGDLNNSLVIETTATITEAGLTKSSAKVVPEGTVLIAMYGATIGKTGIASRPMATNQAIATAVVNEKVVTNRFLQYFLMSQKRLFTLAGQGMAQPNISQTILKAWRIGVPSTEVQEGVVNRLGDQLEFVHRTLETIRLITLKLEAERRSMLHAAFEGTLTKQWRETHHG